MFGDAVAINVMLHASVEGYGVQLWLTAG
jgi:hypothetical protein